MYDNIDIMDQQVGEILKDLEEDGLDNNTIIFFYSDHGDGTPRARRWLYDSGLKVPMIIRFPDARNTGEVNRDLISFVDFALTMLSLTDIPIPEYMEGFAFLGDQKSSPQGLYLCC
jgi:arylsulfatase A-like enzyme